MASEIKRGESLLIPFRNGKSIYDSQCKPRIYKTRKGFEKHFPGHYLGKDGVELVEYKEAKPADAVPAAQYDKLQERYIELQEQYDKIFLEFHDLRDNFISYVCSGVPNPSPFCKNMCPGCCDAYGWCKNNDKCKGFNPAEVFLEVVKYVGTEKTAQEVDFDYSAED